MAVEINTIESDNEICVRRCQKVLIDFPASSRAVENTELASFVKNLESVGYTPSEDLIKACSTLSLADLTTVNNDVMQSLHKAVGADRDFKPMYPNFPEQVMNMSDAQLFWNALLHYWRDGHLLPASQKQPRPSLNEGKLKPLNLGLREEFDDIFTQLSTANTSISSQDQEDLVWFVRHYGNAIGPMLPAEVPNREVKARLCASLIEFTTITERIPLLCNTATDVLRLAVAMSNGDVSLAEPVKFRQFKRSERKVLLSILDGQNNMAEDMIRWKGRWIRLGERLHPGEYKKRYANAAQSFHILRNNTVVDTFNGRVEKALESKDANQVIGLVKSRPGDFARRLDHLLRLDKKTTDSVLRSFGEVAVKVSTPVLLQVMHHFACRNSVQELRVFLPKGQIAKAQAVANSLPELHSAVCQSVKTICTQTLKQRFSQLAPLGKCYIDPELKNYLVPFSQRSAAKSLRTVTRGSRLPLPKADTLRFFIWWKNGLERTDLDLSAVLFDKDFCFLDAITYYNLKNFGGHHSGDIVDAPEGASEFIDISQEKCLQRGVRYVVMALKSYTNQPYCDLPECFAGWMSRKLAASGEIYEPKTVQDKLDVGANTKIAIPALFDLEKGDVIWADIALTKWPFWYNTVAANLWGIQLMLKSMVQLSKANLYDLLKLHAEARGQVVDDKAEAETVFSVTSGTPFDLPKIASEFLRT